MGKKKANEQPADEAAKGGKTSPVQELLSWVIPILAAVLLVLVLKNYVIINAVVPTGSMLDTIEEGDRLIGARLAYRTKDPQRGDVVIFNFYPNGNIKGSSDPNESVLYIKRIIGLPGETVILQDGKVYIDDMEPLSEEYLTRDWVNTTEPYKFTVPEGCYLLLGDNRDDSADARYWNNPYVAREDIVGKALFVYYPFRNAKFF